MGPDMTGVLEVEVEASDQHTRGNGQHARGIASNKKIYVQIPFKSCPRFLAYRYPASWEYL